MLTPANPAAEPSPLATAVKTSRTDSGTPAAKARRRGMHLLDEQDYRFVLAGFHSLLPLVADTEPHLRGVIEDALTHPGSMVRAQLAYAIMRSYRVDSIRARSAAVAIEYFHTASLIFDDLPAMDNAVERRGRACPHVAYGEAAAQLGGLALINQAYALLWEVLDTLPLRQRRRVSDLVTRSLGVQGVLNGQSRDLHFSQSAGRASDVLAVAEGKTVPLIRLTLVLPALIGGADAAALGHLDRLSELWGLSYQIMDDFKDCLMTDQEAGKSTARDAELGRPNLPSATGIEGAGQRLLELMAEARREVDQFQAGTDLRSLLDNLQGILDQERARVEARIPVAAA